MVTCMVDGCDHTSCLQKDMNSHLSGEGHIRHMILMKQSITESFIKISLSWRQTMPKL
jgi:hypothetical protein